MFRWLLLLTLLNGISLWWFKEGFLLTRTALPDHSTPADIAPVKPRFKRAVIVVIDALRFDFVAPTNVSEEKPFLNKLPAIARLLETGDRTALLFHFLADPPTTTMQRLKALTTGSLPTFIDASNNFASSEITEDTWLHQLYSLGHRVAFMGDDTWTSLFPLHGNTSVFSYAHPYPSFDVFDLHSVDTGCEKHIFRYLNGTHTSLESGENPSVVIAHFLGVDHCGHRYGPDHTEMDRKLQQINEDLQKVIDLIDDETVLFVMGMDGKGDHGGDSPLEVDAAFFAYNRRPFYSSSERFDDIAESWNAEKIGQHEWKSPFATQTNHQYPSISQIDFVPTLSLLLGVPIPFGNLGSIIPQFFYFNDGSSSEEQNLAKAMQANAIQIYRYLKLYETKHPGDLPEEQMDSLKEIYKDIVAFPKSSEDTNSVSKNLLSMRKFMAYALEMCRRVWARFDEKLMTQGSIALILVWGFLVCVYSRISTNALPFISTVIRKTLAGGLLGAIIGGYMYVRWDTGSWAYTAVTFAIIHPMLMLLTQRTNITMSPQKLLGIVAILSHALSYASNSFVVHEDRVLLFLIQTLHFGQLYRAYRLQNSTKKAVVIAYVSLIVFVRLMAAFQMCREEQLPYCETTFSQTTSSSSSWIPDIVLVSLAILFLVLPHFIRFANQRLLEREKQSSGLFQSWVTIYLSISHVLIFGYWFIEYQESRLADLSRQNSDWKNSEAIAASLKVMVGKIMHAFIWIFGAIGFFIFRKASSRIRALAFMLVSWNIAISVQLPMAILVMILILSYSIVYLYILTEDPNDTFDRTLPLSFLSSMVFFATGHQATFSSIPFQTGFIGLSEFSFYLSGAMVVGNVLGPSIFVGCVMVIVSAIWSSTEKTRSKSVLESTMTKCLHQSTVTLLSTLTTAHLRRHLMVWKIFAPRFMLSAIELVFVTNFCTLLVFLLLE